MSSSAEKGKTAVSPFAPVLRPILPAPAASKGEPAAGNGNPATIRVQVENESSPTRITGAPTINQQLATHLASQMTTSTAVKLPVAKRKRGSLDSPLTGFKMKHNIMHTADPEGKRIGFIGAGNIARAIVEGWTDGGGCGFKWHACMLHVRYASVGHVKPVNMTATVRTLASPNMKLMKVPKNN